MESKIIWNAALATEVIHDTIICNIIHMYMLHRPKPEKCSCLGCQQGAKHHSVAMGNHDTQGPLRRG